MKNTNHDHIRKSVRENYGKIAGSAKSGCGCSSSCCGDPSAANAEDASLALGYTSEDLAAVPKGANLGLGCGDPRAIASLKKGETVLDLGSGAGFDCFLAAKAVGDQGRVIGVDMTPEMLGKARANAEKGQYKNVEFRLGEIENLPVADGIIDVVISNCVINLSPEKEKVFKEMRRVLKPGGRVAISDVVTTAKLPENIKKDLALHSACISGASSIEELTAIMQKAGFSEIKIEPKDESKKFIRQWAPGQNIEDYIVSAEIRAEKRT